MATPIAARLLQIKKRIPELFSLPGTLLYVGANHRRCHYLAELVAAGHIVTLLEVYERNVEFYRDNPLLQEIIHGDVRNSDVFTDRQWDVAFWWHGPEHVFRHDLEQALSNLEEHADFIVLGCPLGIFRQPAVFGNPNEQHVGTYYPVDFETLGYEVATMGHRDVMSSNLLAWKENHGE